MLCYRSEFWEVKLLAKAVGTTPNFVRRAVNLLSCLHDRYFPLVFVGHVGAPLPCNLIKLVDVPEKNYFTSKGKGEVEIT